MLQSPQKQAEVSHSECVNEGRLTLTTVECENVWFKNNMYEIWLVKEFLSFLVRSFVYVL